MPTEQTQNQTQTTTQTTEGEPAPISREEFQKVAALADSLGANLRKEREATAKRIASLEDTIKTLAEKKPEPEKPQGDAAQQLQAKYDAELSALKKQVAEREKLLAEEKQQRVTQEEQTALANALTAKGVVGAHLEGAMALIYLAEKRVARDDNGNIGIKFTRQGYDEIVPLDAGLDELFKAEKYRIYLPTRPVAGSGTIPGRPTQQGPHKLTKEEAKAEAMKALIPLVLGNR